MAFVIGGVLAIYISLTTFWLFPHREWLTVHNLLVVISLALTAFVGYQFRVAQRSISEMLLGVGLFFSVIMLLYIGSYAATTAWFADGMAWIPFFYHDYNRHGFTSVSDYLNHRNNYRELLELQIFSFVIGSVMYIVAGSVGYVGRVLLDALKEGR
jgi:hypothetical protein